jgi:hypothetical protein
MCPWPSASLVKHLATWEYVWIVRTFGHPTGCLPVDDGHEYADVRIEPYETTAEILAFYDAARAASDETRRDNHAQRAG